jgi:hypothetical protein
MSIYATWLSFDDDSPFAGDRPPLKYQGSHVMPTEDDHRDGSVFLCAIPAFVPYNRAGVEDYPDGVEDQVLPWLRLSVNAETVLLDASQVREVHETLGQWLERSSEVVLPDAGS